MKLIIFFLLPLQICAQNITGLWTGFIHTTDKDLPYELAISENDGKFSGYSHTTFTLNGIQEIGVKAVTIKNKNGKVIVEDEALVFNDFSIAPVKGIRQFDFLVLIIEDTSMMLNGTFKTNKIRNYRSITGTIELRKIDTSKKTKIIPKLNELNLLNTLSFLQTKPKEKEVVAVKTVVVEKVKADIPIKKEMEISAPAAIKEPPSILRPQPKEVAIVAPSEKEKKSEIILQPEIKEKEVAIVPSSVREKKPEVVPQQEIKPKEVAITTSSEKEKKPEIVPQPKEKETTIVTSSEKEKKPEVVLQTKPKETTIVTSSEKEKKPEIVLQTKPKQVVNTSPPVAIKKSPPVPLSQEKEKQIAAISKPPTVKKEQYDTLPQTKNSVTASLPTETKQMPVKVPVVSAAELTKRKTEMIQNIFFKSDSLTLTLYDNGEVDGDTVSVVLNGKVIIASQGLTTNAINKTIYVTPDLGDSLQLVMYAENLGSIPPNTGLLILQDGNDRYEIRFAGDFQKNSAIILRRRHL